MTPTQIILALIALILGIAPAFAFQAGLRQMRYTDPVSGQPAPMLVWYPTAVEGRAVVRGLRFG